MTVRRWRIGGRCKTFLVLFLTSAVLHALAGGALAGSFQEQLAGMRALRDQLKENPEQLSTKQKQELVRMLDESLGTMAPALGAIAGPNMREGLAIMNDVVKLLQLDGAKAEALLKKLAALDDWMAETVALTQLLQPEAAARQAGSGQRGSTLVAEFSGSDTHTTRPFRVADRWEIQWGYKPSGLFANGGLFQIYLYEEGGDRPDIVAYQMQPGSGSAYRPKGGRYYLDRNQV